ncbi:hypothetical protein Leryth_022156 [Lithospermum erythrorhizon]|nr:hypothetical protein Leryth_022156 [Lithospermum erythrorhizon]
MGNELTNIEVEIVGNKRTKTNKSTCRINLFNISFFLEGTVFIDSTLGEDQFSGHTRFTWYSCRES